MNTKVDKCVRNAPKTKSHAGLQLFIHCWWSVSTPSRGINSHQMSLKTHKQHVTNFRQCTLPWRVLSMGILSHVWNTAIKGNWIKVRTCHFSHPKRKPPPPPLKKNWHLALELSKIYVWYPLPTYQTIVLMTHMLARVEMHYVHTCSIVTISQSK